MTEPRVPRVSQERLEQILIRDRRLHSEHDEWFKLAADLRDARRALAAADAKQEQTERALKDSIEHVVLADQIVNEAINEAAGAVLGMPDGRPGDRVAAVVERIKRAEASAGRLRGALERACREDMDGQCVGCGADSSETHGPHCFVGAALADSDALVLGEAASDRKETGGDR